MEVPTLTEQSPSSADLRQICNTSKNTRASVNATSFNTAGMGPQAGLRLDEIYSEISLEFTSQTHSSNLVLTLDPRSAKNDSDFTTIRSPYLSFTFFVAECAMILTIFLPLKSNNSIFYWRPQLFLW